jgi:hypothetical protein
MTGSAAPMWDEILPGSGATRGHLGATEPPETAANQTPVETPETAS